MTNATAWTGFRAALIALCLSLPTGATAASLSLGDAALEVGSVADLAISVDDASGIEGASMRVTSRPGCRPHGLEVHVTSMTSGCMLVSNTRQPGLVQIGFACVQPLSGSGPLLTIKVLGHGVGSSGLTISGCNINEGAMTCTQNPGVASVQAASDPVPNPAAAPSEDLAGTDGNRSLSFPAA